MPPASTVPRRRLKTETLRGLPRAGSADAAPRQWFHFLHMLRRHPESMEFVYLAPAQSDAVSFNPYDLQIVPHADINQASFYTMSSSGVTHFADGSVEFTPLDQWEREYHLFNQISQLNVFRMYKLWKGWATWKRFVCKRKQRFARAALEKQLFLLNPIFQRSLKRLRELCYSLSVLRLQDMKRGTLYTLEEFIRKQHERHEAVRATLSEFSAGTAATVHEACEQAMKQLEERLFGRTSGGEDDAAAAAAAGHRAATPGHALKLGATLHKPGEGDANNQFSYAITAARRSEQRRLLNYIRLADYMVCDTLHVLLVDSVSDILAIVSHQPAVTIPQPQVPLPQASAAPARDAHGQHTPHGHEVKAPEPPKPKVEEKKKEPDAAALQAAAIKASKAVFRVEIFLEEKEGLVFSPSTDQFQRRMDETMGGFSDLLGVVKRLLTNTELRSFVEAGTEAEMMGSLSDLIGDDKHLELMSEVKHALALAFDDADQYRTLFLPFMRVNNTNRELDIEEMRTEVVAGTRTLNTFRDDIEKYNLQYDDVNRLVIASDIGIIMVDTRVLKETFLPSPKHCLAQISTLLPQLAAERYRLFVSRIHEAHSKLTTPPGDVEEFVDFISFGQRCTEAAEAEEAAYREVHSHYELMDEFNVPVPGMDAAAYQTLSQDFQAYKSSLEVAEASKEEYVQRFTVDLAKEVEEVEKEAAVLRERAQHEMVLDESSNRDTVLAFTGDLMAKMSTLKAQAARVIKYQRLFKTTEHEFETLEAIAEEIELKHTLWQALKDWTELTAKWATERFDMVDTVYMEEKITRYTKIVSKLERGLVPNKVVPKLKSTVLEYKETLPVIQSLRNQAMKESHWAKVQTEIGHELVRDENFTLGLLLQFQVGLYKDRIIAISTEATQEAALEQLLHKVQSKWATIEFTLNPYKDSKDVFILGAVDEVIVALEDSMVTMTTITASRYVGGIRAEVEKMEKALKLFADVLDEWLECQKQWMYLESIFSAPDIQRQLPNESKSFFSVDKMFKVGAQPCGMCARERVNIGVGRKPNVPRTGAPRDRAKCFPKCFPSVCVRVRFSGHHAPHSRPRQRAGGGHHARLPRAAEQGQRDAGARAEEPGGLPGDEAHGVPALLLPVQRRAAGDPGADEERAGCAASHEQVLRRHPLARLRRRPQVHRHLRHDVCRGREGEPGQEPQGARQRRAVAHGRRAEHAAVAAPPGQERLPELPRDAPQALGAAAAGAAGAGGLADLLGQGGGGLDEGGRPRGRDDGV